MTDNQIDMADCSNLAAERDSVSDAKISNGPLIWWLYPVFGHAGAR
jgi:hypothetical protein